MIGSIGAKAMTNLTDPIFTDADKAREHFEHIRWPNGPVCSHCGTVDQATLVHGKSHRLGMYQCNACREPFTVTTGTVMESSHIPLNKWALGFHLMAASKKGMSAHQLHRMLGITYKSAWFMAHRIREAMGIDTADPIGGEGSTIEIDSAYIGGKDKNRHANKRKHLHGTLGKAPVFTLVERSGRVRSFHIANVDGKSLADVVNRHIAPRSTVYSDDDHTTQFAAKRFKTDSVRHAHGEYVKGDVHTNTVEGYFSILKRGITGVYHAVSEAHLHRYLKEFDFRYSNRIALGVDDVLRTMRAIKGAEGKRLTYRQSSSAGAA
jgi:transposase-like protein